MLLSEFINSQTVLHNTVLISNYTLIHSHIYLFISICQSPTSPVGSVITEMKKQAWSAPLGAPSITGETYFKRKCAREAYNGGEGEYGFFWMVDVFKKDFLMERHRG